MRKKINSDILTSLPEEILSEILRHVASNSITDFINTKLSCTTFLRASNYDYIFENVSMEKFDLVASRKSEKYLQKRCKAANNAEALYREGMVDCFKRRKLESGLRCLKKAAEKGHIEAQYTCGIILICFGGEVRKQGLQVVSSLDLTKSNVKSSRIIVNCRLKTDEFLGNMPGVYVSLVEPKRMSCDCDLDIKEKPNCSNPLDRNWKPRYNLDSCSDSCFWSTRCDSCFWDREATLFCSLVRTYFRNWNSLVFSITKNM